MHMTFFPISSARDIVNRKLIVMSEYNVLMPDSIPVWQFLYMSNEAQKRRRLRVQAAEEGKIFIG